MLCTSIKRFDILLGLIAALSFVLPTSTSTAAVQRRLFARSQGYLIIEALDEELIHFELAARLPPAVDQALYTSPMVAKTDYQGAQSPLWSEDGLETTALKITVAADLCITTFDKIRALILNRLCPQGLDQAWKTLNIASPATKNIYGLGQYFTDQRADGDWMGRVWDPLPDSFGAQLRGFAGGANNYSLFPIMYALGEGKQNYAMFFDVVYKQMWDFRHAPWTVGMWGDQIRWYVIAGQDLPSLRRSYMKLTGLPPVPPRRSFGLWVSEFGFGNWDEVDQTLASLRRRHFPVDGFALDLQWFGSSFADPDQSRMGSLSWDLNAFSNPREKIRHYADDHGLQLMLIEEPYISKTLSEHAVLSARGYLAKACEGCSPTYLNYNPWWGRGGMLDYTSPAAGDFWHDWRRQPLVAMGINDHWADLGEPEQYDASSWYYGFPQLNKHAHADIHNIFALRWMESIWRGYHRQKNDQRAFLLSRTGTAGIQRFGVGMWSGDIGSGWGNLRSQMNARLHMSLSGIDYYGSDIGGFQKDRSGADGLSEQLYTQWFAASAALDVPVRPHAWNLDKQRSTSPSERGDVQANLANLRLRYQLTPYYYSLAHQAAQTGEPVFPPLVHYFQDDRKVRGLGDEALVGPQLLVALAADPDAVSRSVYLPAGDWVDLRRADWYTSTGEDVAGMPLYADGHFQLPMFARAGALIPTMVVDDGTLNNRGKRADGRQDFTLGLKAFLDETASSFTLYEDDGETNGGSVARTLLSQQRRGQQASITIAATTGGYRGMPQARPYELEVFARQALAALVRVNGRALPLCTPGGDDSCFVNERGRIIIKIGSLPINQDKTVDLVLENHKSRSAYKNRL